MRNPPKYRNWAFVMAGVFGLLLALGWLVTQPQLPDWVQSVLAVVGWPGLVLSLVLGCLWAYESAIYNRLRRGEGVLGQWPVSDRMWEGYLRAVEKRRAAMPDYRHLVRRYPAAIPDMQVIVGEKGIIVGDDFHQLRFEDKDVTITWMDLFHDEGVDVCEIHFQMRVSRKNGTEQIIMLALRFPVASDQIQATQDIMEIFRLQQASRG